MKALITGIAGQDGSYLAELLLSKGYEVWGTMRRHSTFGTGRIDHIFDMLHLEYCHLTDGLRIANLLNEIQPDEVYHLAAQSHVAVSFIDPVYTTDVDVLGTIRILEAIRQMKVRPKFYNAASSEMFGNAPIPQNERTPFEPVSPYGCAKLCSYWNTINYRTAYNMFACNGILFNHESPRRGETFVSRKITRAATRIKEGLQSELRLGNLGAKRDWGYALDYVKAMWLMLQQDRPDDYVIATEESHTVNEFCAKAFSILNLDYSKYVVIDDRLKRPNEVSLLRGDTDKAQAWLDWKSETTFDELIEMMVKSDWELAKKEKLCLSA